MCVRMNNQVRNQAKSPESSKFPHEITQPCKHLYKKLLLCHYVSSVQVLINGPTAF